MNYSRWNPKTQCTVCLSYWNIGILYCTCGHFLHKERGCNQKIISNTMDLLSVPEYVIKKGRPHGHRYGKKPGDKEYFTANQLKKRCKNKYFQGIHDRFKRDPEFRCRMIENYRDEELCRRWDAVADEDHTHHLTTQENSLYKSKRRLHSNKQGSDTMPLNQRPDFKQALSTLHRLQRHKCLLTQTKVNNGHRVLLLHGGNGKVHGGLLILPKVTMEMHQVLNERRDLLIAVFGKILRGKTSMNSIFVLQMDRFQLTAVYCNRRESNDPFSRCKSVQ